MSCVSFIYLAAMWPVMRLKLLFVLPKQQIDPRKKIVTRVVELEKFERFLQLVGRDR